MRVTTRHRLLVISLIVICFLVFYYYYQTTHEPYSAFCKTLCKIGVPSSCEQLSGPGVLGKSLVCAADEAALLACKCPVPPANKCPQIVNGADISCSNCEEVESDEFSIKAPSVQRMCANLPDTARCSFNGQCQSGACGRKTAAATDEGNYVCCADGTDLFLGHDYCKEMPNGSVCMSDAMCASDYCDGSNGLGKKGTCANKPASSCFLPHTLVRMADGTEQRIDTVKVGDLVRSGRSGEPVRVLLVDRAERENVLIVGINTYVPFATADHSFIGESYPRVCADVALALSLKHYDPSEVCALTVGVRLKHNQEIKHVSRVVMSECVVYNLITEDHSYIVNGFSVNDDFPEVHKHPRVARRILAILSALVDSGETLDLDTHVYRVCYTDDSAITDEEMGKCLEILNSRPDLVPVADELWEKWFDRLS